MQKYYDEKEVVKDIIIDQLEGLGDYLDVKQMAQNIKDHEEFDIAKLIKGGTLPFEIIKGERKVKLEDFVEYYAEVFDEISENGVDKDRYFSDNEEEYFFSNDYYFGC
jgi:hypothetical protein